MIVNRRGLLRSFGLPSSSRFLSSLACSVCFVERLVLKFPAAVNLQPWISELAVRSPSSSPTREVLALLPSYVASLTVNLQKVLLTSEALLSSPQRLFSLRCCETVYLGQFPWSYFLVSWQLSLPWTV